MNGDTLTTAQDRSGALRELIEAQRQASFRPEFRPATSDAEALGVLIAHYFQWDGQPIVEAFLAALEDANFHTFHETVERLWREHVGDLGDAP